MKFAAAVTLYNPTQREIDYIKRYSESFDTIILFDNSEFPYTKTSNGFDENIKVIDGNGNQGLSVAFNRIFEFLDGQDVDYLCILDQDSIFEEQDISNIKDFIENASDSNWGIIAPYVKLQDSDHIREKRFRESKWVIASGSFVNMNILYTLRIRCDEAYFIDRFEIDLCEQFRQHGYKVIIYYGAVLYQTLGDGHKHPGHTPLRHYYIFRNRFYFNKKWYGNRKIYRRILNFLQTGRHLMEIMLFENDKLKKCKAFFYAILDYREGKMGKCLELNRFIKKVI
jgi:rhamnosyltransferase